MVFRVLDASAFYAGIPFASSEKSYTTSLVLDEIKHIKKSHEAVSVLIDAKRLEIVNPEEIYLKKVSSKAKETGDFQTLSRSDISVIALCLQLNGELVTDDFAASNIATHLNLKVAPVMTKGITSVVNWVYFCPGCKKTFSKISKCPLCGNRLRRRLGKRKPSSSPVRNRAVV